MTNRAKTYQTPSQKIEELEEKVAQLKKDYSAEIDARRLDKERHDEELGKELTKVFNLQQNLDNAQYTARLSKQQVHALEVALARHQGYIDRVHDSDSLENPKVLHTGDDEEKKNVFFDTSDWLADVTK